MFRHFFSILFGIIDITEPAIEDDDTSLFTPVMDEPPVLHTHPITAAALQTPDQLIGCLAAYRLDSVSDWQVGHIRAVSETRFGIQALFSPEQSGLAEKWRYLNELFYAWYV